MAYGKITKVVSIFVRMFIICCKKVYILGFFGGAFDLVIIIEEVKLLNNFLWLDLFLSAFTGFVSFFTSQILYQERDDFFDTFFGSWIIMVA